MDLQPRSIGELLTDGLVHLRKTAVQVALLAMPFCVVELVVRDSIFGLLPILLEGVTPETPLREAGRTLALLGGAVAGLVLLLAFATQLLSVAITTHAAARVFGQQLAPMEVLTSTVKKSLGIIQTTLLWFLAVVLFGILIPGAVWFAAVFLTASTIVGLLASVLWLAWFVIVMILLGLRWAVWPQVFALEGLKGRAALSRSGRLMGPPGVRMSQNPKFRFSLLLLIYFVVQSAVQQLFLLPTMLRGIDQTPPFSDVSLWSMPLLWALPLAFFQVTTNALILPLNGVLSTLFYLDLRVRYEGFDLDDADREPPA